MKAAIPIIKSMKETTLGGNQWKENSKRFSWIPRSDQSGQYGTEGESRHANTEDGVIALRPMEIRTFMVFT